MAQLLESHLKRYISNPDQLEEDLFRDLSVDREDLNNSCFNQTALFAKWAVMTSMADNMYRRYKRHVAEEVWPQACQKARQDLESEGKKITETAVEHRACLDPAYNAAKEIQVKHGAVLDILKRVESAFWHRKAMLEVLKFRTGREENAAPKPQTELEEWANRAGKPDNDMSIEDLEAAAKNILKRSKGGT